MENRFIALKDNLNESRELHMTFSLSERNYAILADEIVEIVQLPSLSYLEKMPENIVGLMNLRGKIISVIDIRKFLGIEIEKYTAENQILIVNLNDTLVGVIVDSVNDVIPFDENTLEKLPYKTSHDYIKGVYNHENTLIASLNLESVVKELEDVSFENVDIDEKISLENKLLPVDPLSVEKLNKRALSLQKEIKVELDKNYFIKDKFVSFCLNREMYCISLKYVKEFSKIKNVNITPVPCVPDFIVGLVNLRGEFITIVDIKYFLQIPKTEVTDKTKIIVIRTDNLQIGLLVDEVFDIVNIPVENLRADKSTSFERDKFSIGEVIRDDNSVMSILNLERLLGDERLYFEDAI